MWLPKSAQVPSPSWGDSITDGRGSTTNGNDRWPDVLARRVEAAPETHAIGVLNLGIGGNRLLRDGSGPNALARLDRDVLACWKVFSPLRLENCEIRKSLRELAEFTLRDKRHDRTQYRWQKPWSCHPQRRTVCRLGFSGWWFVISNHANLVNGASQVRKPIFLAAR